MEDFDYREVLSNVRISRILKNHNIPHYEKDGHVYADCMYAGEPLFKYVDDLTGYTVKKLRDWLGY